MAVTLPKFRVGEPVRYEALSVFPLFSDVSGHVEYALTEEALAGGSATVEEISEGGSVPDLLVDNRGDKRLLLLEGEELRGAKQNRILNTSVLVAAYTRLKIPVSCVEQGRWRYMERHFQSSGHHATAKLRRAIKASVGSSLKSKRGHRADQGEVWDQVAELNASREVDSPTAAMSDAFESYKDRLNEFRDKLKYVDGASGLAVAIGKRVVSVDFFDQPATCQKVWDRLLSGMVLEALEASQTDDVTAATDVEQLLGLAKDFDWHNVDSVGEGSEYRAESPRGDYASALLLDGTMVHGSIMVAG